MKKFVYMLLLAVFSCQLTGCDWESPKETKEYIATQLMCNIDNAINMNTMADEEEIRESMYAFSDLFSNNVYKKLGDLTESYEAIRESVGGYLETFDRQTISRETDILKATYLYTTGEGKKGYIYFVANVGTGIHTRGLQYLHVADQLETIETCEEKDCGIFVNGKDVVPYQGCEEIQCRDGHTIYENVVDYGWGDADALAKEVANEFIQCLKEKDNEQMKNMFSNSIWRYDAKLDEEIREFMIAYDGVEIQNYEVDVDFEEGSTSTSYLKDSEGNSNTTDGHGEYGIDVTIYLQTNQGEKELCLHVESQYEPNVARVGISQVYECKNEQEVNVIGFLLLN